MALAQEAGRFRSDLMFRLRVIPVFLPPLRARGEDVMLLVRKFIEERNPRARRRIERVAPATAKILTSYSWPGNVRELRNVLDRAIYIATAAGDPKLKILDLPVLSRAAGASEWDFKDGESYRETRARYEHEFEQRYVSWLLGKHGGNVSAAARAAKMDRKYLHDLARRHGLRERG